MRAEIKNCEDVSENKHLLFLTILKTRTKIKNSEDVSGNKHLLFLTILETRTSVVFSSAGFCIFKRKHYTTYLSIFPEKICTNLVNANKSSTQYSFYLFQCVKLRLTHSAHSVHCL